MNQEVFKGPLLHPEILKKYKKVDLGSAHKIIESALDESKARRGLQNKTFEAVKGENKSRNWVFHWSFHYCDWSFVSLHGSCNLWLYFFRCFCYCNG